MVDRAPNSRKDIEQQASSKKNHRRHRQEARGPGSSGCCEIIAWHEVCMSLKQQEKCNLCNCISAHLALSIMGVLLIKSICYLRSRLPCRCVSVTPFREGACPLGAVTAEATISFTAGPIPFQSVFGSVHSPVEHSIRPLGPTISPCG